MNSNSVTRAAQKYSIVAETMISVDDEPSGVSRGMVAGSGALVCGAVGKALNEKWKIFGLRTDNKVERKFWDES